MAERKKSTYNGSKNLVPLTPEKARQIGAIGGKKSGETKRRKRDMRELARALLEQSYSTIKAQELLGDDAELLEGDLTVANVLNMRMIQEANNGNVKAYESIRDTAGYKPVEQVQMDANVMTEADRALLDKVAKRTEEQGKS